MDRRNEEVDYESYSEDFEQDDDDEEEEEEGDACIREESEEDEIKVYKSLTGPSITIQPRPRKSKLRTPLKTESDGSLLKNSPKRPLPKWNSAVQKDVSKLGKAAQAPKVIIKPNKVETATSAAKSETTTPNTTALKRPIKPELRSKPMLSKSRFAQSFSSLNIGKPGTRRVPGTTNVNNRGYTRSKQHAVSPYLPPMRLGPAKPPGTVAQRVASAKRMTVNDLKNKIGQLYGEIEELRRENRTLNHMQNRQGLALKKWEGRDAELPKLLQQHKEELRNTHEQFKKASIQCRDLEEKLRAKNKKLLVYESELGRLKRLVAKEDLQERQALEREMEIVSVNLSGAEKRLRQYMRHVEILGKNHQHQIATEQQKIIRANNHALELQDEIARVKLALRDKDRMLNYIQMRTTGRTLIRSYQDKERIQLTRYQFPNLETADGRSESRSDYFAGDRRVSARSRSLEIQRSQMEGLDQRCDYEKASKKCRSGRDSSVIIDCSNQYVYKHQPRSLSLDMNSNDRENPQQEVSVANIQKEHSNSAEHDNHTHRSLHAEAKYSEAIPSSHNSPHEETNSHSYYHMSQMLEPENEDMRSALPPKLPVRNPVQNQIEKVRKHRPTESRRNLKGQPAAVKMKQDRSQTLLKTKPPYSKQSKTTVVEFRDEHNRKIKQYTSTSVGCHNNHNQGATKQYKQQETISEKANIPHASHHSHLNKSDKPVEFDNHLQLHRPRPHSKASGNREKGLEVRVQIIKNQGDKFETQNSSTSTSRSSSEVSVHIQDNDFIPEKQSPSSHVNSEEPMVYTHRQKPVAHFDDDHGDSSRSQRKYRMDGGDASTRKLSCLESEPEEMVRYHEAAIGDFLSSSRTQHNIVTPRNHRENLNLSPPYSEPIKRPSIAHSPKDSFEGADADMAISQAYSTSVPAMSSSRHLSTDLDQFGFFTTSPHYSENMETLSGRTRNYSDQGLQSHDSQDPSYIGHQQQQLSPRGANSYPQMAQKQDSYRETQPQARGIFSTRESMTPRRQNNQPMNLPFFSATSESRQHKVDPQYRQQVPQTYHQGRDFNPLTGRNSFEEPYYNPVLHQTPNQNTSGRRQDSKDAYDPNFYTKLGTWK